jgi:hypothetical protein
MRTKGRSYKPAVEAGAQSADKLAMMVRFVIDRPEAGWGISDLAPARLEMAWIEASLPYASISDFCVSTPQGD